MRFIFEELVVRNPTVKTYLNSDTRFRSYDLKKNHMELNAYSVPMACCASFPDRTTLLFQISDCWLAPTIDR